MTAAADQWNGLVKTRLPRSGDVRLRSQRNCAALVLPVDSVGPRRRAQFDARSADGRVGVVPTGLRSIHDELNTLAETQRLLAILAATAAREGGAQESPWVNLAERARLLASRAERARETLAGMLRSRTEQDGFE